MSNDANISRGQVAPRNGRVSFPVCTKLITIIEWMSFRFLLEVTRHGFLSTLRLYTRPPTLSLLNPATFLLPLTSQWNPCLSCLCVGVCVCVKGNDKQTQEETPSDIIIILPTTVISYFSFLYCERKSLEFQYENNRYL